MKTLRLGIKGNYRVELRCEKMNLDMVGYEYFVLSVGWLLGSGEDRELAGPFSTIYKAWDDVDARIKKGD